MKKKNIKLILCLILSMVMLISVIFVSAVASETPFDEELDVPETPDVPEDHDHNFGAWQAIPGNVSKHVHRCECGKVEHEDCSFDGGVVTTKPTQNSTGVMTYTCQVCGGTKTEKIDKLTVDEDAPTDEGGKPWIWIVVIVAGALAVAGGAAVAVRVVNKKKSSVADNIDAESADE